MILKCLERNAEKYPDKTAFSDSSSEITWGALLRDVKAAATAVISMVPEVNRPVAVLIDRNIGSVIAFLGVSVSRNFYVPVDLTQPEERVRSILQQIQPALIISACSIPEGYAEILTGNLAEIDSIRETPVREDLIRERQKDALDTDPLYAICTSGSTGVPKSVLIPHRAVNDFIPVFCGTFGLTGDDVFGNQAPFDFDVSVKDIYSAIYCGASVFIIPKVCFAMPKLLMKELDQRKVTTVIWAVSALCIVAGINAFKHLRPGSLNKIMFSGEVMPVKMLKVWMNQYPDALFVNLYGPTEITCNCLYYIVDHEMEYEKLPLGIPFKNERVVFLDENNSEIGTGGTGEICVMGTCLALGYYRDIRKTDEVFVQNPLNSSWHEVMYRTGDLAVLKPDGQYYFTARKDFQIKHMGHRIELEELETHIHSLDNVMRAVCILDEDRNKIVCFYTGSADQKDMVVALRKKLPKYMIPNIFVQIGDFPVTKNGKVDRRRLKEMWKEGQVSG